jgi:hypothetical protein
MGKRTTVQMVALLFGAIYLAVGIIGFLPFLGGSVTLTNSKLLGLFNINLLHNLVLLLLGVLGVFVANPLGLLYIGQLDIPLHLVTGAVLAYFGFAATVSTRSA